MVAGQWKTRSDHKHYGRKSQHSRLRGETVAFRLILQEGAERAVAYGISLARSLDELPLPRCLRSCHSWLLGKCDSIMVEECKSSSLSGYLGPCMMPLLGGKVTFGPQTPKQSCYMSNNYIHLHAGCLSRRTLGTNTCDEVGRGACCAVTEASQQSQMTPQDSGLCMTVSTTVGLCTHASGSCSRTDSEVFRTGERLFSKWLFKDQVAPQRRFLSC
nr:uncharacterized protein LOC109731236 isoform X2 [Microcebus murinus]